MIKAAAALIGLVFLLLGVLGFVPGVTSIGDDGMPMVFGIFTVGSIHNYIHLATGAIGLLAASSFRYSRWYLQIFGLTFAFVAIAGFVQQDTVLGLFTVNMADNILHTVLAIAMLSSGIWLKGDEIEPSEQPIHKAM